MFLLPCPHLGTIMGMLYVCCMCVVCVLYDVVCTLYVEHFKTATKTPTQNYPRSQPHHHEDAACMLNASKLASVCYAKLPERWLRAAGLSIRFTADL